MPKYVIYSILKYLKPSVYLAIFGHFSLITRFEIFARHILANQGFVAFSQTI